MPIFMDRHQLAGATAQQVAEAHLKDLAIQDRYGVKILTYWFDEARGSNSIWFRRRTDRRRTECIARPTATSPPRWSRWILLRWRPFSAG
jgi:hypothetical protein